MYFFQSSPFNDSYKIQSQACTAKPGAYVEAVIDHCLSDSPYESLYGEDWKKYIAKSDACKVHVCVTEMVEHIIQASAKLMKGTKHEEDWVFYHDALSVMTSRDTIDWMREKDYLRQYINNGHLDIDHLWFHLVQL